jgi:enoyl-CoA hydratase
MLEFDRFDGGLVVVGTLNRPTRRNALDLETLRQLSNSLEDLTLQNVRVFILRGAGGHFSAGADLEAVATATFRAELRRALVSLTRVPFVTMAYIEGSCLGGGLQVALNCDVRVAGPDTRLGIPAAKLGVAVDAATVDRLAQLIGGGRARAMLLAAEEFSSGQAATSGLVDRLGSFDDALAWARDIAKLAPLTIAAHKVAFATMHTRTSGSEEVQSAHDQAWTSADFIEGRKAFAEKRPPVFLGR